ncbi:MAG: hypothetical protein WAM66_12650 [Acidobacteriaceae bacterium]
MKSILLVLLCIGPALHAQEIPQQLWGAWRITRILPARTISCWGEKDAELLLGTEIRYSAHGFRWKGKDVNKPKVEVKLFTAQQFKDTYSSPSVNGSQVSFKQLGIHSKEIQEIDIEHPAADITGATTEIPGDSVLLKNKNTIIFSVCNVYFEAHKMASKTHIDRQ